MSRKEEKIKREIKDIVTCINLYHGKTLVSICGLPNHIDSVCRLFETFSAWDVNIDMISFTPSPSPLIAIAFTAEAHQLENIFKAVGDLKQTHTDRSGSGTMQSSFFGQGTGGKKRKRRLYFQCVCQIRHCYRYYHNFP